MRTGHRAGISVPRDLPNRGIRYCPLVGPGVVLPVGKHRCWTGPWPEQCGATGSCTSHAAVRCREFFEPGRGADPPIPISAGTENARRATCRGTPELHLLPIPGRLVGGLPYLADSPKINISHDHVTVGPVPPASRSSVVAFAYAHWCLSASLDRRPDLGGTATVRRDLSGSDRKEHPLNGGSRNPIR